MAYKQATQKHVTLTIVGLVIALGFLIFVASVVRQGAGDTRSRASRDVFLTAGDDALSLQEDLKNLQSDPALSDEQELESLQ